MYSLFIFGEFLQQEIAKYDASKGKPLFIYAAYQNVRRVTHSSAPPRRVTVPTAAIVCLRARLWVPHTLLQRY
jgi:hypothetical protein